MPVHEVARWPAWEIDLLDHYMAKEPPEGFRTEVMLAQIAAILGTVHQKTGSAPKKIADMLLWSDVWPDGRYSEVDQEVMRNLL